MSTNGPGAPLAINATNVWRGTDRTNGFVMKSVDGRIPALQESFSRLGIGAGSALFTDGIVPYGCGLWRDIGNIDTLPGAVYADKPTKGYFAGVLKFEQGVQTGHPVAGHGLAAGYMKGTLVRKALVGYKHTMTAVGQEANYLNYLKGVVAQDTGTVRKVYADWVAAWKAAADGTKLAIFFAIASGFPIMAVVDPILIDADLPVPAAAYPTLANTVFGGYVEILEPENQTVYIDLRARF